MDQPNGFEAKGVDRNGSEKPGNVATKLRRAKSALSSIVALCLSDTDPASKLVRVALTAERVLRELEGERYG